MHIDNYKNIQLVIAKVIVIAVVFTVHGYYSYTYIIIQLHAAETYIPSMQINRNLYI